MPAAPRSPRRRKACSLGRPRRAGRGRKERGSVPAKGLLATRCHAPVAEHSWQPAPNRAATHGPFLSLARPLARSPFCAPEPRSSGGRRRRPRRSSEAACRVPAGSGRPGLTMPRGVAGGPSASRAAGRPGRAASLPCAPRPPTDRAHAPNRRQAPPASGPSASGCSPRSPAAEGLPRFLPPPRPAPGTREPRTREGSSEAGRGVCPAGVGPVLRRPSLCLLGSPLRSDREHFAFEAKLLQKTRWSHEFRCSKQKRINWCRWSLLIKMIQKLREQPRGLRALQFRLFFI